jgi:NADH-quinone oxidoreductase subunit L
MNTLPWLILFLPFLAAAGITLLPPRKPESSAGISIGAILGSLFLTLILLVAHGWRMPAEEVGVAWLEVANLRVDFGLRLDTLSIMMLAIVTFVGAIIHIYSYGYLHGDPGLSRYYASLSLFTFSMLGIVLANNFLQLFIFWELVGVSSYLLIGFWYQRPAAADAAKKAFLTNRVGDFGFLLGILLVWGLMGSLHFGELEEMLRANPAALGGLATAAGLLIFCGAVGKSAQFPLHVWLPDAMEGPTPVSALIHAATMVAAGVYMLCRIFFLLNAPALLVIAWIGGLTALLAAVIALQQNDIKRILAYSTLSQLGFMVMAVGLHSPGPAMFHLTTHAFFKALLFLGAGSVIVALHHEQNIWKMGGLKSRMPVTFWTFLLGTLALCGVPPFSGFYSKDTILAAAFNANALLFALAVVTAVLTPFYMFRLFLVAFLGPVRSEESGRAVESPKVMSAPLLVLTVPAVLAGFWGIESIYAGHFGVESAFHPASLFGYLVEPFVHSPAAALFGLLAAGLGFSLAYGLYSDAEADPLPAKLGALSRAMRNRFYFDEIYERLIAFTQEAAAKLADAIDRWIIAGFIIKGAHGTTELFGRALRLAQTGNLQTYAFLLVVGVGLLMYLALRS